MKILGVIPSRFASSRFPGKPLIDINGKSMIQRVYECANESKLLTDLVVATDDKRIYNAVKDFGGRVEMTLLTHKNGTERCAEIAQENEDYDLIINIQGDEPFQSYRNIDILIEQILESGSDIATLAIRSESIEEFGMQSNIKVVFNRNKEALYFSRSPIPYHITDGHAHFYKHIGIYGFKRNALLQLVRLPESELEKTESLEQLRWMDHGFTIHIAETQHKSYSIDTPEDLELIRQYIDKP